MTKKLIVNITDEQGLLLDRKEIDIVALDISIRTAAEERGETAAARALAAASSEVDDSLAHEIAAAWRRLRGA